MDVAVTNNQSSNLSIVVGNGDGTFRYPPLNYRTDKGPICVAGGDFNMDGFSDLVVANFRSNSVTILLTLPLGQRRA